MATGSYPARLPIPGIETAKNSDDVLAMDTLPVSAVIIGGGVIGIEFATLLSSLDVHVTVVEMASEILPGTDAEIAASMRKLMEKRGVTFHTSARVLSVQEGMECLFESAGKEQRTAGEIVIVAVGRRPATEGIGLEAAGIQTERGFVQVDDTMRTSKNSVYAIGDITGKLQLAHAASAQGTVAAYNACGGNRNMRYNIIPSCVYSHPEIASVDLHKPRHRQKASP